MDCIEIDYCPEHPELSWDTDAELAAIKEAQPEIDMKPFDAVVARLRAGYGLIEAFHTTQETYGYLPRQVLEGIASELSLPLSRVYGVATFYTQFRLKPVGKYVIDVCMGTACHVAGAPLIVEALSQELEIPVGETTQDRLFTLRDSQLRRRLCAGARRPHRRRRDPRAHDAEHGAQACPSAPQERGGLVATAISRAARVERALERATKADGHISDDAGRELRICAGTACHASGRVAIKKAIVDELERHGLTDQITIVETGCHGFCQQGPIVVIRPQGIFYPQLKPRDIPRVIETSVLGDGVAEDLLYRDPVSGDPVALEAEIPFYALQRRLVLALNGKIDPHSIRDYFAHGGYRALAKVLAEGDPEAVIELIEASGLRGRGGAGFPAARKWRFTRATQAERKFLICNADEGDPGAFMDRSVLEGNPHSVIEGMLIGAFAIGATDGYVYVRHEYPFAVERLRKALDQAREQGLLGKNILDSGFDFDIRVNQGAGAFVCGEETALLASIEGRRGMPRPRPPYPAVSGLWGYPTNTNNVETWANVPWIVNNGTEAYDAMGTGTAKGTKIFSLTGKVTNGGLVEVPMGATLRRVIFDIGGGMLPGRHFKAVQLGGPSGGCLPEHCWTHRSTSRASSPPDR